MPILIALDCDGTLDVSNGPIPVSRIQELNIHPYIQIVVVSPSRYCVQLPFPRFVTGDTRLENLLAALAHYPSSIFNIYCSDNPGDDETARMAGFTYVHPKNFNFPLI